MHISLPPPRQGHIINKNPGAGPGTWKPEVSNLANIQIYRYYENIHLFYLNNQLFVFAYTRLNWLKIQRYG